VKPLMQQLKQLAQSMQEQLMIHEFPEMNPILSELNKIDLAWKMLDEERDKHRKSSLAYKRLDEVNLGLLRLGKGGANESVAETDLSNNKEALESHYKEMIARIRDGVDLDPPTEVEMMASLSSQSLVGPSAAPGSNLNGFVNTMEYLMRRNLPSADMDYAYNHPNGFTETEMWHIDHTIKHLKFNFKWVNGTRKKTLLS
tara:strand:- start:3096 stop:3695 length:600 start_codon:yes stop_codon:yes gene_type:complete